MSSVTISHLPSSPMCLKFIQRSSPKPLLMGKRLGARKGGAACLLPRCCLGSLFETEFLPHKPKLMVSLSIFIWSMKGYLLIQMFIYLCKMKFGSRILTQWKGLNWGLKQLSVLFLMAHLIVEKLIWRRNPNCTRFLKVSLNLTCFNLALQFGRC